MKKSKKVKTGGVALADGIIFLSERRQEVVERKNNKKKKKNNKIIKYIKKIDNI